MTNPQKTSDAADTKRVFDAVAEYRSAMLVTIDPDGAPRARPMAILEVTPSGEMWFASREQTGKIFEIARDSSSGVTLQSGANSISLTGTAQTLRDVERAKKLWTPMLTAWFPDGPEDPALALIRFTPEHAEIWETGARETLRVVFESIKAVVKGEKVDPPASQHTSVTL